MSNAPEISSRHWLTVGVLTFCYAVSMLDRYVLNLLIQPIATSFAISDVQISLLVGFAFTLFYSTVGLYLGRVADRSDRRRLIAMGIAIWTAATACTGAAWNYASLLAARIAVATGEAALSPSAYSLIADTFPRAQMSRPVSIFFLGGAIGPGLALVVGSMLLSLAEKLRGTPLLTLLGDEPWRLVMLLAAVPGTLALIAVLAFVRDPRKSHTIQDTLEASGETLVSELRRQPRLYAGLLGGTALLVLYLNGLVVWWPTYMLRAHAWPLSRSGFAFGIALLMAAMIGATLAGWLARRITMTQDELGTMSTVRLLSGIAIVPMAVATLVPIAELQLVAVALTLAVAIGLNSIIPAAFQLAAPPLLRARVSALYVSLTAVVGAGGGPLVVALLGDTNFSGAKIGLGVAIALLGMFCGVAMTLLFGVARRAWTTQRPAID